MFNILSRDKKPKEIRMQMQHPVHCNIWRMDSFGQSLPCSCSLKELSVDPEISKLKAEVTELRAALGVMLSTWGTSTEKLVDYMKDMDSKEKAKIYMDTVPAMFDAAVAARVIYTRTQ